MSLLRSGWRSTAASSTFPWGMMEMDPTCMAPSVASRSTSQSSLGVALGLCASPRTQVFFFSMWKLWLFPIRASIFFHLFFLPCAACRLAGRLNPCRARTVYCLRCNSNYGSKLPDRLCLGIKLILKCQKKGPGSMCDTLRDKPIRIFQIES